MQATVARKLSLLMVLLCSILFSLGLANSAQAQAATCYGASCFGIDPEQSGCSADAVTEFGNDYTAPNDASFRVNMRYSPSCGAGWLQLIDYGSGDHGWAFDPSAWNPSASSSHLSGSLNNVAWTSMVDATGGKQVCGGTQLYENGSWYNWLYVGCYTP